MGLGVNDAHLERNRVPATLLSMVVPVNHVHRAWYPRTVTHAQVVLQVVLRLLATHVNCAHQESFLLVALLHATLVRSQNFLI